MASGRERRACVPLKPGTCRRRKPPMATLIRTGRSESGENSPRGSISAMALSRTGTWTKPSAGTKSPRAGMSPGSRKKRHRLRQGLCPLPTSIKELACTGTVLRRQLLPVSASASRSSDSRHVVWLCPGYGTGFAGAEALPSAEAMPAPASNPATAEAKDMPCHGRDASGARESLRQARRERRQMIRAFGRASRRLDRLLDLAGRATSPILPAR